MSQWTSASHALDYLARADQIPHRTEGEAVVLDHIPKQVGCILDLGSGDGRLLALLQLDRPQMQGIALDFSPAMLAAARQRFAGDDRVAVISHDLRQSLPPLGSFDAIVSSFAIHHLEHDRKYALYREIFDHLAPGGIFCNLEHVASPTEGLHRHFMAAIGYRPEDEDPENRLLDMETQLNWLRQIGFDHVDCYWKWLEMALLVGYRPA